MTTPLVPFAFDPPATDYEYDLTHLAFRDVEGGQEVSWPLIGASLFLPGQDTSRKFEAIEANNKNKFKAHGLSGFSLGNYHEFLLDSAEEFACIKMGNVEATFGEPTPLVVLIFKPYHYRKYHAYWDDIASLRIFGIGVDDVEAAFINASAAYGAKFGTLPRQYHLTPYEMDDFGSDDGDEDSDDGDEPEIVVAPPIVTNIEPLRFFYNGLSQVDDAAACLYFYRVLEYFSFLINAREMKKLRHDDTVSEAEFSKRILDLVIKDEKRPILRLIDSLVNSAMLNRALSDGLIVNAVSGQLCEAMYTLRNSLAHGKFSYGYTLRSGSLIEEDPQLRKWKTLLCDLARRALDQYGSKRT